MASGSLKDLLKAINSGIAEESLPLPDELIEVIQSYVDKHPNIDDNDFSKLDDELLGLYRDHVEDYPRRLAVFLAIMQELRQARSSPARTSKWWDVLMPPILNFLGKDKNLSDQFKAVLLAALVYDRDDDRKQDVESAAIVASKLLSTWLKISTESTNHDSSGHSRFIIKHLKATLLSFGRKRPKDFLIAVDKFFIKQDSRGLILSLLSEFIRNQPPHLHQLLETPLFMNLLRCLTIDTSTTIISLAMTVLTMFLPHIPSSLSPHLPWLFNIYTRILFWERERVKPSKVLNFKPDSEKQPESSSTVDGERDWDKAVYSFETDDETIPELIHYFTFLYGLYPINFTSYIRKPQRYLRHANFPNADEVEIEPAEIRKRTEAFQQIHLLHPNFFSMTIESELTDSNRWIKSEAADVVAECMALCSSVYSSGNGSASALVRPMPPSDSRPRLSSNGLSDRGLVDREEESATERNPITPAESRHLSWRNTQSTAVASPEENRHSTGLHRKASSASQSGPSSEANSPNFRPRENGPDSPTLPPQMLHLSHPPNHLQDMLNSQKSLRGSLQQSHANESVQSLMLNQSNSASSVHVDAYLQSLTQPTVPRSPSLRPVTNNGPPNIAYLQREIMLLRNDLNFERYLKQQHLSHIGQLRQRQVREAAVEAETQNLINSNKLLRSKLDDSKRSSAQLKKESEKSRMHAKKWEADLTAKLRTIREEQKKSIIEREALQRDLTSIRESNSSLRHLVIESESVKLLSQQKVQSIESELKGYENVKSEVELLRKEIRLKERLLNDNRYAQDSRLQALNRVELLEVRLASKEDELVQCQRQYAMEMDTLKCQLGDTLARQRSSRSDSPVDTSFTAGRSRLLDAQRAYDSLNKRYNVLQAQMLALRDSRFESGLSPANSNQSQSSTDRSQGHGPNNDARRQRQHASSEPEPLVSSDRNQQASGESSTSFQLRQGNVESYTQIMSMPAGYAEGRASSFGHASPLANLGGFNPHRRTLSTDGGSSNGGDWTSTELEQTNSKPKIKPQSEQRIYGRGGVQNIGKKEKEKERKDKKKEEADKKDKKTLGLRGIRGFG